MNISFYSLTKNQTNIIKAVAMIILVLHNYIHTTNNIGDNEVEFDSSHIYALFEAINSSHTMFFNGLFTYFGFYAIELFIFISGYGLAKQYQKNSSQSYFKYLAPRLIKIYSLLLFGIILLFVCFFPHYTFNQLISIAVSYLFMLNIFSMERMFEFNTGPWWYFGLIIQLYLIFPFIYKIIIKYKYRGIFALALICYVIMFACIPLTNKYNIPFFCSFLGHLPEFMLGICFAIFPKFRLNGKIIGFSLVVFILSCFFESFFPFSFLSATVLLLAIVYPLINMKSYPKLKNILISLGTVSMFMFLINGPMRDYTLPYFKYKHPLKILLGAVIHLLLVIFFSYIASFIFNRTMKPLRSKLIDRLK